MEREAFVDKLREGGVVPLSKQEWEGIAKDFPTVASFDTQLAGELLLVRVGDEIAAVEAPSSEARVARLLGDLDTAMAFVKRRLAEYERMWDGCGVKVDYYEKTSDSADTR